MSNFWTCMAGFLLIFPFMSLVLAILLVILDWGGYCKVAGIHRNTRRSLCCLCWWSLLLISQGLGRGCSAVDVLQLLASQLQSFGASCSISLPDFSINVCFSYPEFKHKFCETTFLMFAGFLCICAITRWKGYIGGFATIDPQQRLLVIYTAKRVILAGFENCPLLLLISLKIKSFTKKKKEAPIWSFNKQLMFYKVNDEYFIPSSDASIIWKLLNVQGYLPGTLKDSKLSDGIGNKRKRDSTGVEYGTKNSSRGDPSFRASVSILGVSTSSV